MSGRGASRAEDGQGRGLHVLGRYMLPLPPACGVRCGGQRARPLVTGLPKPMTRIAVEGLGAAGGLGARGQSARCTVTPCLMRACSGARMLTRTTSCADTVVLLPYHSDLSFHRLLTNVDCLWQILLFHRPLPAAVAARGGPLPLGPTLVLTTLG